MTFSLSHTTQRIVGRSFLARRRLSQWLPVRSPRKTLRKYNSGLFPLPRTSRRRKAHIFHYSSQPPKRMCSDLSQRSLALSPLRQPECFDVLVVGGPKDRVTTRLGGLHSLVCV